ncbi:glycosyltransferase family 4 protein [Salinarimonas ramus]|uniref:Glycosyl transferase n=1 Tax=Salinarimonas ramus TaxID=690164 RepID=A0A917V6L5_9HYPH|nr:glycosyltransferase family 4 protein [Salinarimonas ramus]GGK44897.1 glycosyl transferase [Salinarimonas ramus]
MSDPVPPRRILVTCDAVGGVWRHALDMARALAPHGIETVLVAFGPEPSVDQRQEARGVEGLTLLWFDHPLDWLVADETALDGIPAVLDGVATLYDVDLLHLNYPSHARGLQTVRPVLVMAHSCMATWWAAMRRGETFAEDAGDLPDAFALNARLVRQGLARADRVIAPSRAHAHAMRVAYGPLPGLAIVPNASFAESRAAEPEPSEGGPVALAVGRWWDEAKNAATLDAAAALASIRVVAIGATDGPQGQSVAFAHAQARGALPAQETRAALARAAVFVSPARYEPFGLAVLEAAQEGCALVLADIPTFRELWEGAALFVDPHDAEGFAAAIDRIAGDPRLHALQAAAARERAAAYDPDLQAERLLALYADALATSAARTPLAETA